MTYIFTAYCSLNFVHDSTLHSFRDLFQRKLLHGMFIVKCPIASFSFPTPKQCNCLRGHNDILIGFKEANVLPIFTLPLLAWH